MNFNRLVEIELRELLTVEIEEYESQYELTEEEKKELYDWVSDGQSPYSN